MVLALLGLMLLIAGIFMYRKNKTLVGGLMIFIGGSLIVLGIVAIVSFHP
jgi:hypothetical protein